MCFPPSVFPNAPGGGWTMDGDNREQVSYMPASAGGVVMPPVPPRSFPPGSTNSTQQDDRQIFMLELDNNKHFISFILCNHDHLTSTGHFLMHCDAYHHQNSEPPPALPVRSLRKVQPCYYG